MMDELEPGRTSSAQSLFRQVEPVAAPEFILMIKRQKGFS
jgi:hypothetical protein